MHDLPRGGPVGQVQDGAARRTVDVDPPAARQPQASPVVLDEVRADGQLGLGLVLDGPVLPRLRGLDEEVSGLAESWEVQAVCPEAVVVAAQGSSCEGWPNVLVRMLLCALAIREAARVASSADPTGGSAMQDYTAPTLRELGSLHDLTMTVKTVGQADGVLFDPDGPGPQAPIPIGEAS
jgi:hypothetical protein